MNLLLFLKWASRCFILLNLRLASSEEIEIDLLFFLFHFEMNDELTRLCLSALFTKMDQTQAPEPKQHANQRRCKAGSRLFTCFPFWMTQTQILRPFLSGYDLFLITKRTCRRVTVSSSEGDKIQIQRSGRSSRIFCSRVVQQRLFLSLPWCKLAV